MLFEHKRIKNKVVWLIVIVFIAMLLSACNKADPYEYWMKLNDVDFSSESYLADLTNVMENMPSSIAHEFDEINMISEEQNDLSIKLTEAKIELENATSVKSIYNNGFSEEKYTEFLYLYQLKDGTYVGSRGYGDEFVFEGISSLQTCLGSFSRNPPESSYFVGDLVITGSARMEVGNRLQDWDKIWVISAYKSFEEAEIKWNVRKAEVDCRYDEASSTVSDCIASIERNKSRLISIVESKIQVDIYSQEVNNPLSNNSLAEDNISNQKDGTSDDFREFEKTENINYLVNPKMNLVDEGYLSYRTMTYDDGVLFEMDYDANQEYIYRFSASLLEGISNYSNGYYGDVVFYSEDEMIQIFENEINEFRNLIYDEVEFGNILTNDDLMIVPINEKIRIIDHDDDEVISKERTTTMTWRSKGEMDIEFVSYDLIDKKVLIFNTEYDFSNTIQYIPVEKASNNRNYSADLNSAKSLLDTGMQYYNDGYLELAASLFHAATLLEVNSTDLDSIALANYNLACVISLLIKNEQYNHIEECISYLEKSFLLREDRIPRSLEDPDLDNIRDAEIFTKLIEKYRF